MLTKDILRVNHSVSPEHRRLDLVQTRKYEAPVGLNCLGDVYDAPSTLIVPRSRISFGVIGTLVGSRSAQGPEDGHRVSEQLGVQRE